MTDRRRNRKLRRKVRRLLAWGTDSVPRHLCPWGRTGSVQHKREPAKAAAALDSSEGDAFPSASPAPSDHTMDPEQRRTNMNLRATVRCTSCHWSGQRKDPARSPCPRCGSDVAQVRRGQGRPAAPSELRRVEVRVRVLPATRAALGEYAPARAAEILDTWARERRSRNAT